VTPTELLRVLDAARGHSALAAAFFELLTDRERADCAALLVREAPLRLARGQVLFTSGSRAADEPAYWLLDGCVEEWQGPFRLSQRFAGDLVGELPALLTTQRIARGRRSAQPQTTTAIARDACLLLPVDASTLESALSTFPAFARALLRGLAQHAVDLSDDGGQINEASEEFFPRGVGQLLPGPYECKDVTMSCLPMRLPADPSHLLNRVRPPGVTWLGDIYYLTFVQMRGTQHAGFNATFDYDEVTLFVPARVEGCRVPRVHVPFIYADNVMAVFLGREIAGLPKLQVSTFIEPETPRPLRGSRASGDRWRYTLRRQGQTEVDLRARVVPKGTGSALEWPGLALDAVALARSLCGPITGEARHLERIYRGLAANAPLPLEVPLPLGRMPTTAWKRTFNARAAYPYADMRRVPWRADDFDADALTETPFRVQRVHAFDALRWDVPTHAFSPTFAAAGTAPVGEWGFRMRLSMVMEPGSVLLDYRDDPRFAGDPRLNWGPFGRDDAAP